MAIVRVREGTDAVVQHPEHGAWVALKPGDPYDTLDPLVREFPWAFARDNDVEQATRRPGEKR